MRGDGVENAVRALVEGRAVSNLSDRYSDDVEFAAHLPGQTLRAGDHSARPLAGSTTNPAVSREGLDRWFQRFWPAGCQHRSEVGDPIS